MLRAALMIILGIAISMMVGGLLALWQCSQQRWCPRYLQRQLDKWRWQMTKQNAERRAGKVVRINKPTPPNGDQAA